MDNARVEEFTRILYANLYLVGVRSVTAKMRTQQRFPSLFELDVMSMADTNSRHRQGEWTVFFIPVSYAQHEKWREIAAAEGETIRKGEFHSLEDLLAKIKKE